MQRLLIFIVSLYIFSSCESTDKEFCKCMKVSQDLNQLNSNILDGKTDEKTIINAKKFLKIKKNYCFNSLVSDKTF
jgi:hypothetical protein